MTKPLYESNSHKILTESIWRELDADTRAYLNEWDDLVRMMRKAMPLFEAELTADQINKIFTDAETYAAGRGDMKTGLGKFGTGAKAAGAALAGAAKAPIKLAKQIDAKINELGRVIQDTTPVKGLDAAFERAKKDMYNKLGGKDSKINATVEKLGQLAKDHPGKTKFLIGALTAAAAFAGGPAGGAAAGFMLRAASDLLQGEKLSTAVGKSAKTAAYGALLGMGLEALGDMFGDGMQAVVDKNYPDYMRSEMDWQRFSTETGHDWANAKLVGFPDDIEAGKDAWNTAIEAWKEGNQSAGDAAWDKLGALVDKMNSADYQNSLNVTDQVRAEWANNIAQFDQAMDAIDAAAQGAMQQKGQTAGQAQQGAAQESYDRAKMKHLAGMQLTESEQRVLAEGPMDAIKQAGRSIAKGAKRLGRELGQTVTARKLGQMWAQAGKPTDSASITQLLQKAGLDNEGIGMISKSAGVQLDAPQAQPSAGAQAAPSASGQAQPQAAPQAQAQPQAAPQAQAQPQAAPSAGSQQKPGMVSRIGQAIAGAAKGAYQGARAAVGAPTATQQAQAAGQRGAAALGQQAPSAGGQAAPSAGGQAAPASKEMKLPSKPGEIVTYTNKKGERRDGAYVGPTPNGDMIQLKKGNAVFAIAPQQIVGNEPEPEYDSGTLGDIQKARHQAGLMPNSQFDPSKDAAANPAVAPKADKTTGSATPAPKTVPKGAQRAPVPKGGIPGGVDKTTGSATPAPKAAPKKAAPKKPAGPKA